MLETWAEDAIYQAVKVSKVVRPCWCTLNRSNIFNGLCWRGHPAADAVRLLLSEIQKLKCEHVDLHAGQPRLPDSKTGGRAAPLADRLSPRPPTADRHGYASRALDLGKSLTMFGKLLGHTQLRTTAEYAHLARDSIQTATGRITGSIGGDLLPDTGAPSDHSPH